MTILLEKQQVFAAHIPQLISRAIQLGYKVTLGMVERTPEEARRLGMERSLHVMRLAIDINLFEDGQYIVDGEGHTHLGEFWKSLHPDFRWGGDFKKKDYNHYSMTPDGIRA